MTWYCSLYVSARIASLACNRLVYEPFQESSVFFGAVTCNSSVSKSQFQYRTFRFVIFLTRSQSPPDPFETFGCGFKLPDTGHWRSSTIDPNLSWAPINRPSGLLRKADTSSCETTCTPGPEQIVGEGLREPQHLK